MEALQLRLTKPQTRVRRWLNGREARDLQVALPWGRGTGKSWWLRQSAFLDVAAFDGVKLFDESPRPGIRQIFFMPTLAQFVEVHGEHFERELKNEWGFLGGRLNKTRWRVQFPGGSSIQILSQEKRTKIAGNRTDKVLADESDDIEIATWDGLVGPWLSEPWSLRQRVIAGTPRKGLHGLLYREHRRAEMGEPFCRTLHATYLDTPEITSADYAENERRRIGEPLFKREWLCDFESGEGLVYPMLDSRLHVREPPANVEWTEIAIGVDHGYVHPGAIVVVGIAGHGDDAVCYVLHEIIATQKSEPWWIEQAKRVLKLSDVREASRRDAVRWYFDPSQPARIDAFRSIGCSTRKANNSVEEGIAFLQARLEPRALADAPRRTARLYVSATCQHLLGEFGKYARKRGTGKKADEISEDIVKRNDDALDALRYACFTSLGSPSGRSDSSDYDFG